MSYKLWLKERGEGCHFYIGCGNRLFDLKAKSKEQAKKESAKILEQYTGGDQIVETALILEFVEDISYIVQELGAEAVAAQKEAELEVKREQLKKLKKELGEE